MKVEIAPGFARDDKRYDNRLASLNAVEFENLASLNE
jgi:hypothetical protein